MSSAAVSLPEVWLRGPLPAVPPLLQPVAHALLQAREELARHYLVNTRYSSAEIAFLLGYNDPNSFIRAFHAWTGQTPEGARSAATPP